jgi:hypothetical protein
MFCVADSSRHKVIGEMRKFVNEELPNFYLSPAIIITMLLILYECETWTLTLKEGHRLMVGTGCREECVNLRWRK